MENFSFTLVSTVFNEKRRLSQTIQDIEGQTLKPNEIIITDAGSNDGTYESLLEWSQSSDITIVILQKNKCNVAEGRNLAIQNAKNNIIVSTDFGCRFDARWLDSLIDPFRVDSSIDVVGGSFTVSDSDLNTYAAKADYILQNAYKLILDDHFSVSSRSIAYKKYVWEKIGGYPEWLTLAADDTIFWKLIKKNKFKLVLIDKPYVYWMRHQSHKAFGKEAYRYGLGDGESKINYRNFFSLTLETISRYSFIFFLILSPFLIMDFPFILILIPYFLFGLRSYRKAIMNLIKLREEYPSLSSKVLIHTLWQIEVSRYNYISGYLKGLLSKNPEMAKGKKLLWEKLG